jgi:uncharacterized membrane protein
MTVSRGDQVSARALGRAAGQRDQTPTNDVRTAVLVAALILVTAAAAALRLPFLSHQSLWFDEIFTRTIVARHSLAGIWDQVSRTESTPPLYYLVAKLSSDLAGSRSAAAMRAPSAVALTLAAPVCYFAFRGLIGQRAALAASALVAVNPLLVSYSTDARSYGLFVLTALLSVWGFAAVLGDRCRRCYAGWFLASVACVWTHYFGAFMVAGEAAILLVVVADRRRETLGWSLLICVCAAPLIPLLVHQNTREDAAFIAGITISTRLQQTIRQFGMGPNVPRSWLEAAGLLVLYAGLLAGVLLRIRSFGARVVMALALITAGLPLVLAVLHVEDRFYVRNVIIAVPLLGALAAAGLIRARGIPLAVCLGLASVASIWVATNWRYEQIDWRSALAAARPFDRGIPVITQNGDDATVAAAYLGSAPTGKPISTRRAVLIIAPHRGSGERALVPAPIPASLAAGLREFRVTPAKIVHAFTIIQLTAPTPAQLSPSLLPGATILSATAR